MLPVYRAVILKQNRVTDTFPNGYITRPDVSYQADGNDNNQSGDKGSDEFSPTHLQIFSEGTNEERL